MADTPSAYFRDAIMDNQWVSDVERLSANLSVLYQYMSALFAH